jgi:gas vesicle protein
MKNAPKKHSSHVKAGLVAGALFGIAAGIFMSSKRGKQLAQDLKKHTQAIEARLRKELMNAKNVGEAEYGDAIDKVLDYYTKSRSIAKTEVPALRRYLVGRWDEVRKELAPGTSPKKPATRKKKH